MKKQAGMRPSLTMDQHRWLDNARHYALTRGSVSHRQRPEALIWDEWLLKGNAQAKAEHILADKRRSESSKCKCEK